MNNPLECALAHAAMGHHVLPIHFKENRGVKKLPYIKDWQNRATADPEIIRGWWKQKPDAGVAIHAGKSGLVVVDIDPRNGGNETVAKLESDGCLLRTLPTVSATTGGGGEHYLFRAPNDTVRLPATLGAGVDLLHGNHYFVVAPSHNPYTRTAYAWCNGWNPKEGDPDLDFDPLPNWILNPVQSGPTVSSRSHATLGTIVNEPLADAPPPAETGQEIERVKSALAVIPSNMDRAQWLKVLMALHWTGWECAEELACEWSEHGYDGFDMGEFASDWRSIGRRHKSNVVTLGTLFRMAREYGWNDPRQVVRRDATRRRKFKVVPAPEFVKSGTPSSWLIHGLLPSQGMGMLYGASGSGKSFLILDLCAAIARGGEWRGRKVQQGSACYIAGESAAGVRTRLHALAVHSGKDLDSLMQIGVIGDAPNLLGDDDIEIAEAIKESGNAAIIVVDTLASTTPGANENSSEDMGPVLERCKRLQNATGALVMLVHHSGKEQSRGARGWSGIRAAVDIEIEVTRKGEDRQAKVTKQKDGEDGGVFPFRLVPVYLGVDAHNEPMSSLVVEHVQANGVSTRTHVEPKGSAQKIVWRAAGRMGPCLTEDLITRAAAELTYDPTGGRDRRRQTVRQAMDAMLATGRLVKEGDLLVRSDMDWTETTHAERESVDDL